MTNEFNLGFGTHVIDEFSKLRANGCAWDVSARETTGTAKSKAYRVTASWDKDEDLINAEVHGNMGTTDGGGIPDNPPTLAVEIANDLVKLKITIGNAETEYAVRAKRILI